MLGKDEGTGFVKQVTYIDGKAWHYLNSRSKLCEQASNNTLRCNGTVVIE